MMAEQLRRRVVVEGMDGSGKDGLINSLYQLRSREGTMSTRTGGSPFFTLHERASTSLGGPVAHLEEWVVSDLEDMSFNDKPFLYNRHPLISEPIYAPHRRINRGLQGSFRDPLWISAMRSYMSHHVVLVLCDPGWDAVQGNLFRDPTAHMPGVVENARKLYDKYTELPETWQGPVLVHNYRKNTRQAFIQQLSPLIDWNTNG